MKKSIFEKSIVLISVSLFVTSAYMYLNMDRGRVQLQSPQRGLFAKVEKPKPKEAKNNPYVIWHGSNAMPKGMGQGDEDKPEFMPKWQQDRIKDLRGDPYIGSVKPKPGTTPATPPTTAPSAGITPATPSVPAQEQDKGITPATSKDIP